MPFCLVALSVSFLLGSIPWGVIISRIFYHDDIREHGSGNIGATNAFRTMGTAGGVAVFSLDFLKGLVSAYIVLALAVMVSLDINYMATSAILSGEEPYSVFGVKLVDSLSIQRANTHVFGLFIGIGLLGSMLGHVFSPWLRFKGGKGIAVAAGFVFVGFGWPCFLVLLAVFSLVTVITRYVSAGSLSAAALAPFLAYFALQGEWVLIVLTLLAALLVVWAHRGNIARLRSGNENRIGAKKEAG